MSNPQNFTLLKPQISTEQQTSFNIAELRTQFKKKEGMIADFNKRIEQKREQMKNLSKNVNVLIQKQFKKPVKQRPSFHVTYSSPKLNGLRDEKNKIFAEIERIKQQIKAQKFDHPEAIVNEVFAIQAKIAQLEKDTAKALDTKALITRTLQENKGKIDEMKVNNSLNDLQRKQADLAVIKKQCKQLEKQINMFSAQQLQKSTFFFGMKDRVDEEVIQEIIEVQIDSNEIKQMLREINQIYQKRRIAETQGSLKIKSNQKTIGDLEKSITEKKVQIRQLQNDVLRAALSKKRMHSMVNLRNQYSTNKVNPIPPKQKPIEKKKVFNPEEKKLQKRTVNKIYMIQKDDANCIYIGEWINEAKVLSDRSQIPINSIEKVKSFTFSLSNGRVIGLQSSYIDKNGTPINGKDLIVDVGAEMKVEINIEEVAQLEYSRKSEEFYIRFILNNGSWKQLGQRGSSLEKINLEPYYVRYVEALANDSSTHLTSLKLTLEEKIPEKLGMSDVAERTSSQMSYSNFDSSVKKKVVLKGRSLKKIQQEPIVDHRLMLNKQK